MEKSKQTDSHAEQKVEEYDYWHELFDEKLVDNYEDRNYLNKKYFHESIPLLKHTNSKNINIAKSHYKFKSLNNKNILVPVDDNMKLVCVVRFIWPSKQEEVDETNKEADINIALYMLMGCRLDTTDADYSGVRLNDTSTTSSSAKEKSILENRGESVGAADAIIGHNKSQKNKNEEDFLNFIGSLNNGSLDLTSEKSNISNTYLANNLQTLSHENYIDIENKFKKYLNILFSTMGRSKPFITYILYKIDNSIRKKDFEILNYDNHGNKLHFYKFSVHYKIAIINNTLYYQKEVNNITLHEEESSISTNDANYRHINIPINVINDLSTPFERKKTEDNAIAEAKTILEEEGGEGKERVVPPPEFVNPNRTEPLEVIVDTTAGIEGINPEKQKDPNAPDEDKGGPADPNAPDENKGGPAANKAPPATKTPPAAEITSLEDESGKGEGGEGKKRVVTQGSVSGGYKRKLKRKELNTMSLNELKQLHRNNGIKMNGNKTVNALINNYIKNYK